MLGYEAFATIADNRRCLVPCSGSCTSYNEKNQEIFDESRESGLVGYQPTSRWRIDFVPFIAGALW